MFLTRKSTLAAALLLALLGAQAQAQTADYAPRTASVSRSAPGQSLAAAGGATRGAQVAAFMRGRGASEATAASLRESASHAGRAGTTHLRLQQQVDGMVVYGSYVKAAFDAQGRLAHVIENVATAATVRPAAIDARAALDAALARVHPGVSTALRERDRSGQTVRYAGGSFFHGDPSVTRVAVPMSNGRLEAGYLVETWSKDKNLLNHTLVGGNGRVLNVELRTASDSYNVFVEDPGKNAQSIVNGPGAGNAQSPAGWLAGAQTTFNITGNNVNAYLDSDANNAPDAGGTTVTNGTFGTTADLGVQPTTNGNKAVAVQNLFYLNNVIHDILYTHGFNEAAGNFQVSNFGKGGAGNDPVLAEAQDGSGTDNANFSTPADGSKPRMQMYLWTSTLGAQEVKITGGSTYNAASASFGPALTTTGLTNAIVKASPADACTTVGAAVSGKIALVDRGTCDFVVKVTNAQTAGAVGVIVANNSGTTDFFAMGGTSRKIRIPAVMIGFNDGNALKALAAPGGQMHTKLVPPPQIDASLDSDIVFHEYGHGLSWRMIGGMSGPLAGAIGEGASDVVAMLVNGDDRVGEYSTGSAAGIRRFPYSGYPLTYAGVTGAEVHDDGEIYAAAMWRVIELYAQNGLSSDVVLGDFVDGMNYTPATPAFENMRNGMLQSIGASNDANKTVRCGLVWTAFAEQGIGVGAKGTVSRRGTVTITESLTTPNPVNTCSY